MGCFEFGTILVFGSYACRYALANSCKVIKKHGSILLFVLPFDS
ncbi:hypothetical protein HMPREF9441_02929 [Paraprevotella clara YIT 11840]|uniref:Uncharacterized protein n=1 Tax=Paraprevotella clara YIT 11840 TaxID=762968 RepID=G5SU74_9BACT|nr:hypothetical protein HMPREF9441_02929 [Paraprevotella clara YIT 11840]